MLRRQTPPLHHPRPGIYNAVLRSDLWALPALGTGHRLGIQNAPAGGPLQITDHYLANEVLHTPTGYGSAAPSGTLTPASMVPA